MCSISTVCAYNSANTMESANAEREEMATVNEETPRASPDRDVLKQLLAEVAEIRKENKELRSKVANLTTNTRRQLFQKAKDSDPVCSVSKVILFLTTQIRSYGLT